MKFRKRIPKDEKPQIFKWYDVETHNRYSEYDLNKVKDTRELMSPTRTAGYQIAEDKYAVIICTEISGRNGDTARDITIIPKKWIVKKKY